MSKKNKRKKNRANKQRQNRINNIPYFAYGSNLDLASMQSRTPNAKRGPVATLRDWKLTFRGVADIVRSEGDSVQGAIWYLEPDDIEGLDMYEGYPYMYDREWLDVETDNGVIRALVYIMVDQDEESIMMPSTLYLNTIIDGYHAFGLDNKKLSDAVAAVYDFVDEKYGVENLVPDGKKRMRPKSTGRARPSTTGMSPATRRLYELEDEYQSRTNTVDQGVLGDDYIDIDESWLRDTLWDVLEANISEDRILDVVMETLDEYRQAGEAQDEFARQIAEDDDEDFTPQGVRVA